MNNYYFSNKSLYADCTDPIADIQKIRNQASGAYLSLLDNDSVGNDVLSNILDILIQVGRVQKWFIENPHVLNLQ